MAPAAIQPVENFFTIVLASLSMHIFFAVSSEETGNHVAYQEGCLNWDGHAN